MHAGVNLDETKFNYVVGNLDGKFAAEVHDIWTCPPGSEWTYQRQNIKLINWLSVSQDQKTYRLVEHEEIVDRRPSQFLPNPRALQETFFQILSFAHSGSVGSQRRCWLSWRHRTRPQNNWNCWSVSDVRSVIGLTRSELTLHGRFRNCSRSGPRRKNKEGVCWYHETFCSNAKKCNQPCAYKSENEPGWRWWWPATQARCLAASSLRPTIYVFWYTYEPRKRWGLLARQIETGP